MSFFDQSLYFAAFYWDSAVLVSCKLFRHYLKTSLSRGVAVHKLKCHLAVLKQKKNYCIRQFLDL